MPTPNRSGTGPRPAVPARRKTGRNPVATRNADGVAPQTDPWRVGRRVAWTALAAILPVCALIALRTMSGMPVPHAADQPPPWMAPGMAMIDRLAAIQEATKASPLGNRFANIEKADYLLGIDPPADIAGRQDYELKLAFNLLYAGRTQEAIRRFETIETGLAASQPGAVRPRDRARCHDRRVSPDRGKQTRWCHPHPRCVPGDAQGQRWDPCPRAHHGFDRAVRHRGGAPGARTPGLLSSTQEYQSPSTLIPPSTINVAPVM